MPRGASLFVEPPKDARLGAVLVGSEAVQQARDAGTVLVVELAPTYELEAKLLAPDGTARRGIEVVAWTWDVPVDPVPRPAAACRQADSAAISDDRGACTLRVALGRDVLLAAFDSQGLLAWRHVPSAPTEALRWVISPRSEVVGRCELPDGKAVAAKLSLLPADLPEGLAAALRRRLEAATDGSFTLDLPAGAWRMHGSTRSGNTYYAGSARVEVPPAGASHVIQLQPDS